MRPQCVRERNELLLQFGDGGRRLVQVTRDRQLFDLSHGLQCGGTPEIEDGSLERMCDIAQFLWDDGCPPRPAVVLRSNRTHERSSQPCSGTRDTCRHNNGRLPRGRKWTADRTRTDRPIAQIPVPARLAHAWPKALSGVAMRWAAICRRLRAARPIQRVSRH